MSTLWYLDVESSYIYLFKNGTKLNRSHGGRPSSDDRAELGPVLSVSVNKPDGKLKFTCSNGSPRPQSIDDFQLEKTSFSRKFRKASNAKQFVSIWIKNVSPKLNQQDGKFKEQPSIPRDKIIDDDSFNEREKSRKRPQAIDPPMLLPSSKKKKLSPPADRGQQFDKEIEECCAGIFELPLTCLKEPDPKRCLREPDRMFIERLKDEMKANPTSLVSPIVGLLQSGQEFDKKHPQAYTYETIGGNNSRIALQELSQESQDISSCQTRLVAVYMGLTDELALRLAAKHNRATGFSHSMSTQDKVAICHKMFVNASDKQEWRRECSNMLVEDLSRLDDSMVLFIASLPDEEYDIVQQMFKMYEDCGIKDQHLSKKKREHIRISKLDFKGCLLKPLRGIDVSTRKELLEKVVANELSFADLASACKYAKKMRTVQTSFMRYLDLSSWEAATEKYPEHTTSQSLEPYIDLSFKKKDIPATFASFCRLAKQSKQSLPVASAAHGDDTTEMIQVGKVRAIISKMDVLSIDSERFMATVKDYGFCGLSLTILDPPEDWTRNDVQVVCRLVRSVNAGMGLQAFSIVVFANEPDPQLVKDFTHQCLYIQDKTILDKDSNQILKSISKVILYQWTSSGKVPCFAKNSSFEGNLLTLDKSERTKTSALTGRPTPKPEVYRSLINLLTTSGQWILDPICSQGIICASAVRRERNVIGCDPLPECVGITQKNVLDRQF